MLAVYLIGGQFNFEKTLKTLIAPVGLIWLGLLVQAVFFWFAGKRTASTFSLALWVLLTLSGNQLVARWTDWWLERPFLGTRASALGEFDAVLILGGSTSMTPAGDFQGGSRVFAGLRLFHAGKVKTLLVSGEQPVRPSPDDLDPGEEAKQMLIQSGVPESAIIVLGGLNTSEEIEALAKWLEEKPVSGFRLGILSDASHLDRALSLCQARGIEATGIPSSFETNPFVPNPSLVVPSSANLNKTQNFAYELLGRLIGR